MLLNKTMKMKKIIFAVLLLVFATALHAQGLQKPSKLPPPNNPGQSQQTTPNLKEPADLVVSCSDASLLDGYPYVDRFGREAISNYKIRVTITVTNQGQITCSKGFELTSYVAPNPTGLSSKPTPNVMDLNDRGSTNGENWEFGGCQVRNFLPDGRWDRPCFNFMADEIAPGASVSREFTFDTGNHNFIGKGPTFFFIVLVDNTKRVMEGNEENNVSVPITVNNSLD